MGELGRVAGRDALKATGDVARLADMELAGAEDEALHDESVLRLATLHRDHGDEVEIVVAHGTRQSDELVGAAG